MITSRDIEIRDFLTDYKVASTSTISQFFFPSAWSTYKRLKYLTEQNQIKRMRDSINNEYIYYIKKPKQLRHSLLVTEFYRELSKKYKVVNFKIEPSLGSIRPDAIFGYIKNGKNYLGMLEVEISNKGFNSLKYEKFYSSNEYKNFFPLMPAVFAIGDNIKLSTTTKINYKILPENMNNLIL